MLMKSTRDAYGECLIELGKDERIVVVDADTSTSTRTNKFAKKYPTRFFNVGCAEQNLIATAAGFAYAGKIAIATAYAIFATARTWEQIRSFVAHDRLNVKIIVTHAGLTNAPDGASHHSLEDIALLRVIPNMTVIVPADAEETKQAIRAAVEHQGPCYVRLSRAESPVIFDSSYEFKLGKGAIVRKGKDVAIIAAGNMVPKALEAAEVLAKERISARVINLSTIKPIDEEVVIKAARETGAMVTVEEHNVFGGLGSAAAEVVSTNEPVPMELMGVKDRFGQTSGKTEELYKIYGLTASAIVEAARRALLRKKR
jgi:transketolase